MVDALSLRVLACVEEHPVDTTREVLCQMPRPQVRSPLALPVESSISRRSWTALSIERTSFSFRRVAAGAALARYRAEQECESGRGGCRFGEHEQVSAVHDVSLADFVEQSLRGASPGVSGRVEVMVTIPRTM
ncbi:hypothetical protein [Streptomyces sp. ADI92-24]|uniref:hypothetical protein n=1 Tax=Streptomyces sp. ADI92-24 TaxID=1522756 RepID=UPI000F550C3E|nr:hypothetical protein [Streptomyces sp. ADI92-24]